ncbi:MAG: hypothetical protein KDB69_04550 [Acidimicrobiia bacterium]|nr:hypothetical protein [Acidimicrobiia bacterium]
MKKVLALMVAVAAAAVAVVMLNRSDTEPPDGPGGSWEPSPRPDRS